MYLRTQRRIVTLCHSGRDAGGAKAAELGFAGAGVAGDADCFENLSTAR
jgi:hypothetical protein